MSCQLIRQAQKLIQVASSLKQTRTKTIAVPTDIVEYARYRGIQLSPDQIKVLRSVLSNRPTIVESAHSVGKSLLAALLACWFYETHPNSIGLITAPVNRQISEIIFKEMRRIMPNCKDFAPKANSLYRNAEWWVHGYATNSGDAFQGKHSAGGILIIFDECASVDQIFWDRAHSMFESGKKNHFFLGIGNPYSKSSPMYLEALTGKYNVVNMSALDHPNIVEKREVIAGAITRQTVLERLQSDCRLAEPHELDKAFQFEGQNYVSENPLFDVQILGKYPSQSDFSLYSEEDLANLLIPIPDDPDYMVSIGCDVARYGSCSTVFVVRRGPNIVEVQSFKGLSIVQTAEKLKEFCNKYATKTLSPYRIPCHIDGSGLGCGVIDLKGTGADEDMETYVQGKRTEIWVRARDLARKKALSIALLPKKQQEMLLNELRMPEFTVTNNSLIVLESKEKIIKRLGRSPDFADSFGLACQLDKPTWDTFRNEIPS
jgi:hypothetical protein